MKTAFNADFTAFVFTDGMLDSAPTQGGGSVERCWWLRYGLLAFGWLNVALGLLGAVLPLLPTTVFLLIALWAFSKSSLRFHGWLYSHPRFGPTLQAWHRHRAIPRRAKVLALVAMAGSLLSLVAFVADGWVVAGLVSLVLVPVAAYIVSRPDFVPS